MSRKTKKIVSTFWLAFFSVLIFSFCFSFISPSPVQAQTTGTTAATSSSTTSTGIVSCGTSSAPCTLCHLIVGIKALVDWGTKVLATAAILAVVAAGVMYIISSGSTGMMESAKKFLTASLTGFALVVGAWIIVNTVYWLLSASPSTAGVSASNWYTFTCSTSSSALTSTTPSTSSTTSGTTKTADQIAQDLATCNSGCDQAGGDTTTCKQGCTDTANAATKAAASSTESTAASGTGNSSVVSAAQQAKTNGCKYSQGSRNECTGDPAYTDCGQLACDSMKAAGQNIGDCSSINTKTLYSEAQAIGDSSTLKAGDVLVRNDGSSGHAAICENDGCTTITHAAGVNKGIVTGANNYLLKQDNVKVIKASS